MHEYPPSETLCGMPQELFANAVLGCKHQELIEAHAALDRLAAAGIIDSLKAQPGGLSMLNSHLVASVGCNEVVCDLGSVDESETDFASRHCVPHKSEKARLVDFLIDCTLLVSHLPLSLKHFDRETRQNLKKMGVPAATQVLSDIAGMPWDGIHDIGREVHRMVSHAKAQHKFGRQASPLPNSFYGFNMLYAKLERAMANLC